MQNSKKYLKVMFGNKSFANGTGFEYKIGEINIADNWEPSDFNSKKIGGFNFSTENKILRWLVRGDTIYEVTIPDDAEVVEIESKSAPHGVFRTNKIILNNPQKVTDEIAMKLYFKSDLPEKSYYKAMAGCAIRGYRNTVKQMINDRVNKENIELVLSEIGDFRTASTATPKGNSECFDEMLKILNAIKGAKNGINGCN